MGYNMTFYFKPPKGLLSLHILDKCVEQRLLFYNNYLRDNKHEEYYECLVEDSVLDRTGHFMLRLLAHEDQSFKYCFLKMEISLLEARLNCYNVSDLKYFLKKIVKQSTDNLGQYELNNVFRNIYFVFTNVCSAMLKNDYLDHILSRKHIEDEYCEYFVINVPFYHCPSLLRKRQLSLKGGFLEITCKHWKLCLLSLYENYLLTVLTEMKFSRKVSEILDDDRIKDIFKHTQNFRNCQKREVSSATFDVFNIEAQLKLFPLCMLNLYQILKYSNRLPHNERYDFSLFLKGAGVPLKDALKFWKMLYSKQHSTCSRCTHNWEKNEKRYIYGIRHLYGLEGSRKNYNTKSCHHLQHTTLGPRECGGCPFQHFDDENLTKLLDMFLPNAGNHIEDLMLKKRKSPKEACNFYYSILHQTISGNEALHVCFQNPVEYFSSLRKAVDNLKEKKKS